MNKKLIILIGTVLAVVALAFFLKTGDGGASILWNLSDEGKWLLPLVGVSALLDSVNPCAFSILILTIAFLFSIGKLRSGILKIGGFYIFGIFITYLFIGLGILQVLHLFNTPHFMAKVGASLLVFLGFVNVMGQFFPKFPIRFRIPKVAHEKIASLMEQASIPTAFLLGILVGLCEFPCTGGPYLMVLGLLHDQATYLNGLYYLVLYNLIFILPLVIILLISSDSSVLARVEKWKKDETKNMRLWGGLAMIILGFIIFII